MKDIGHRVAKGAAWMVAMRLADRSLGLINTMVLARLLAPQDFGLVAMATALLAMVEVMGSFSFDLALIQNRNAERRHYDTAWTFNVLVGTCTAIVMVAVAIPATHFFAEPRVEGIVYCLAIGAFVQSFQNIGIVAFRKELDFRKEFLLTALQRVVAVAVAMAFAFALRDYRALVIGIVTSKVANVLISYAMHPYRPSFSLRASRELMGFSSWLLLNNIVLFGAIKGYDFVIGRIAAAHGLGLYSVAYELANLPTTELVHPVSRALYPGFALFSDDLQRLRTAVLRTARVIALVTVPAGVGVAVLAEPVVRLLLGAKWIEVVPMLPVLAVYGIVRTMHTGTGEAYLALGVQRLIALINLPHVVIGLPAMAICLAHFGIDAAGWVILAAGLLGLAVNLFIARAILNIGPNEFLGCYARPLLAALAMLGVEVAMLHVWPPVEQTAVLALRSLAYVVVGALVYTLVLLGLWTAVGRPDGAERFVLDRVRIGKAFMPAGNVDG